MDAHAAPGAAAGPADDGGLTGADDSFGLRGPGTTGPGRDLPVGANLGGVTILGLVAEGGMGRVYAARQEAPRRTVAVKVLRAGAVSAAGAARLLREAETLALLHHPHIAQVHTCGIAPEAYGGVPFLVMEMVDGGQPITEFANARSLSIRERVALVRKACEAVGHAHRLGIVHRDLKPANMLVDAAGEPKLIDFGIASGVASGMAGSEPTGPGGAVAARGEGTTETGDAVGTLRYMSPEQVLAPGSPPDARSDVYAIGLVLHEVLAGALPYDLAGKPLADAVRLLGGLGPPATGPVERAAAAEAGRGDARALAVIVATCLEPGAADRYATAAEVADDLGRWLEGRAIVARPPTLVESVMRLARRHRVAVTALAALAATLVAAVVSTSLLAVRLADQRGQAERAREAAAAEAEAARHHLYASTVLLASAAVERDNLADARRLLGEAEALAAERGAAGPIEVACLAAALDDAVAAVPQSAETLTAVAWSPDGATLATGDRLGVVRVLDAAAATATPRSFASRDGPIWSLAFSPDGDVLAVAAGDGGVSLHDRRSADTRLTLSGHGEAVYAVAFSADGRRIVTGSRDRTARIWNAASGRQERVLDGHDGTVYGVALAADGRTLVTASHDGMLRVWDAGSGRLQTQLGGHTARVFDVAIAADGRRAASASADGTVRVWDLAAGRETACLRHPSRVNAVVFGAAADRVATAAGDGVVRVWDAERGVEVAHLRGHAAAAWSIDWSIAAGRIASGGADGALRIWDAAGRPDVATMDARVLAAAFAPDGSTIAAGTADAEVRLWDAATLDDRGRLGPAVGRVNGVAWSPDGSLVAAACDDGVAVVWDARSRERLRAERVHARRVYAVAFSGAGDRVATASEDRTVAVWNPRTGGRVADALSHPRRVFCAAFAPGDAWLATACEDRLVRVWDRSLAEPRRLAGHSGPVNWVAFSPDGGRLASASSDGTVRLWNVADGAAAHVLTGPVGQVWKTAFSADGTRVGAVGADGAVHLWDAATGRPILALRGHSEPAWAIAFAPDGRSLVSGSWDGTLRLWGVAAAELAGRRHAAR